MDFMFVQGVKYLASYAAGYLLGPILSEANNEKVSYVAALEDKDNWDDLMSGLFLKWGAPFVTKDITFSTFKPWIIGAGVAVLPTVLLRGAGLNGSWYIYILLALLGYWINVNNYDQ
jgi:hypothetical protein